MTADRGLRLEIFACSGGMAAGFAAAGLPFDLAFDRDADACTSYERNLGVRPVQIDVRDLLRLVRAGWRPGFVDLIVADPPCAPWSRAGKRRGLDDERDALAETVEIIALLRPRAALIGNIPGLDDTPHLGIVQKTIGGLARHGYCARDFTSIDAAAFGVPQHRVRPFWYAHREGACIRWPEPTHGPVAASLLLPGVAALRPYVTCAEALAGLLASARAASEAARRIEADLGSSEEVREAARAAERAAWDELGRLVRLRHEGKRTVPRHPPSEGDAPARTVTASDGGGSKRSLVLDGQPPPPSKRDPSTRGAQSSRIGDPDTPARTLDTRVARAGSGDNGTLAWPWDRPATTVCAGLDVLSPPKRSGSHGEPQAAHPNAIVLSERAVKLLQGFPEDWQIVGKTKAARFSQIGQATCIAVAEAIARAVKTALEE